MKKILTIFMCILMAIAPLTASATGLPTETTIKMGDVNSDGKVTASDARTVLRMSASLESSASVEMLSCDADGNAKITSSDARTILRVSAGLSSFSCGFDGEGNSNAIKVLSSGKYQVSADFGDNFDITIAKDGNDIYMTMDSFASEMAALGAENCGMLITGGNMYATLDMTDGSRIAIPISDEEAVSNGFSTDEISEYLNLISNMFPGTDVSPVKYTSEGTDYIVYSYANNGLQSTVKIGMNGKIGNVESSEAGLSEKELLNITSLTADISADLFNISSYTILDIDIG